MTTLRDAVSVPSLCVKGSPLTARFTNTEGHAPVRTVMEDLHLTMSDVFTLFGRHAEDTRCVASADSQEYLAVVLYLVQRNNGR